MSKEIAQTVGGKRIAWLVAILAAFAVFATVGSQWQGAKANVNGADVVVTNAPGGNLLPGQTETYTLTYTITGSNHVGSTTIAGVLDSDLTITSITPPPGPVPTCTGVGTSSFSCAFATPMTVGATGTLVVAATLNGTAANNVPLTPATATIDDQSAQGAQPATVTTTAVLQNNAVLALTKSGPTGPIVLGSNVVYTLTITNTGLAAAVGAITDTLPAAFSAIQSITTTSGACTPTSFPSTTLAVSCTGIALPATTGTATVTITGTTNSASTATSFSNQGFYTSTVNAVTGPSGSSNIVTTSTTFVAVAPVLPALCPGLFHLDAAGNLLIDTSPTGIDPGVDGILGTADDCQKGLRDTDNNVVGFNHVVVYVPPVGGAGIAPPSAIIPPAVTLTGSQTAFRIDTVSGTPNVNGQNLQLISPANATAAMYSNGGTFTGAQWYSTGPGEQNITVINAAGEVVADFADGPGLNNSSPDVATCTEGRFGCAGITGGLTPLVKEWNILVPTTITGAPTAASAAVGLVPARSAAENALLGNAVNIDGTQGTLGVTFNPTTSTYQNATGVSVYENVLAQHTNASGIQTFFAQGAKVTFKSSGTCGNIAINGGFVVGATGIFAVNNPVDTLTGLAGSTSSVPTTGTTVTSLGTGPITVTLSAPVNAARPCTLLGGATIGFTVQAAYPNNLGSNTPVVAPETFSVRLTATIPTKQVFLAWAGQRIILEHDWRIPAGDIDGGASASPLASGRCPFQDPTNPKDVDGQFFPVSYIKGSGPGNFLPSLGAILNGSDQATVWVGNEDVQNDNQVPGGPNVNCISRVLFESEDQGQVDIEAFYDPNFPGTSAPGPVVPAFDSQNQTKIAFVVYYMKLNTVNVSLATQVSKPTHNSTGSDYAPGNPWDASKDAASNAADWNVSRDLLVRGRITGWFLTSNPSGRAADTSNPLNVLPANRWVMPNDWALLAGGPADKADNSPSIGTAEAFRPEYDIMINPGRGTRGLDTPEGTFLSAAATLGADLAATSNSVTIKLPAAPIVAGATIRIDNEDMTVVTAPVANALGTLATMTVNRGQNSTTVAAHTTGAIVLIRGAAQTPFEGPFSLLDLAALGASGALSNWDWNNVRDTVFKDGDVDWWDAPMPPALTTVDIRGTGFIKQVLKQDVYYTGTPNVPLSQTYPNPFYISNIPDSPYIPAVVAGGGFYWDSWGSDGAGNAGVVDVGIPTNGQGVYRFWQPIPTLIAAVPGQNPVGTTDTSVSSGQLTELNAIRTAYGDGTIGRTLVVYSDNHGEFMVTANGDFKTDLSACATNTLAGGKHCKTGDKVGTGSIYATADYPDFRGKHFPVMSNTATVTWTWGGYKDVTVEKGETDQFKYVVFHALDRDGFCSAASFGAVSLHPVLSGAANDAFNGAPKETVDFLIDSGQGIIIGTSGGATTGVNDGKQFATGLTTYSTLVNDPLVTGIQEFPNSPLAAAGAVDECQAWIKVSNSLLGVLNILAIAHNDEGNVGFDKIIDLTNTTSYTLNFRWSLVTWAGADGISINDAIKGTGTTGKNPGGNDISASVTAIYGWDQAAQQWLGFFPTGVNVPGANDLTSLKTGQAFWIAITGPGSVTWTVASNVN